MTVDDIQRFNHELDKELQRLFVPGECFEIDRRLGGLTRLQRERLRLPLFEKVRAAVERDRFSEETLRAILMTKLLSFTIDLGGVELVTVFDLLGLADW